MAELFALHELLARGRDVDAPVAMRDRAVLRYAEFATCAAHWRQAFVQVAGARVALYFEDSAEFAAALLGAWHAGKDVVLPADVLPDTLRRLQPLVDAAAGDLPEQSVLPRVQRCAEGSETTTWSPLDPTCTLLYVFTSGSTGQPKLIPKRLAQLEREIAALETAFAARIGRGCVHASVTHQHMYGLPFRLLWPLASGRVFAARRTVFPEDMVRALEASPDGVLITSPAHLKRLPEQLDWTRARTSMRALFSSAGPLPDAALPLCDRVFGQRPIEIYGSSETGAVAWRRRDIDVATAWQPLPGMQVRIEGDALSLRADWLENAGWQCGADRVVPRGEGFELLGRSDRIVKIEEKRVSLATIERALCDSGLVEEARALLLPGERARLAAVVVPSAAGWQLHDHDSRRALGERLRSVLADMVEAVALPRHWRFPWAMPVNASGKTTEAALLALFDARRPQARLLQHTPDAATLQIEVAANSPYFDGHFAGSPILPGVTQVDWVIRFAHELFALPPNFARLENAKFHDWIGADTRIELALQRTAADSLAYRISSAAGLHASGRILFREQP